MRDGDTETGEAGVFVWSNDDDLGDILAYRTEHTKNVMKALKEKELKDVKIHYHVKDDKITKEDLLGSRSHRIEEFDGGRAPILWNAMKDKLTPKELENLKQVILDGSVWVCDEPFLEVAFYWCKTKQGDEYWSNISTRIYSGTPTQEESAEELEVAEDDVSAVSTAKAFKSDGGSSDYYKIPLKLPKTLYDEFGNEVTEVVFETQDIIYAFCGGEWTLGNVMKSIRRSWLALLGGGKEGNTVDYDALKMVWFSTDFRKRFGNNENL